MQQEVDFLSALLVAAVIAIIVLASLLGVRSRKLKAAEKALANDPKRIGRIAELEYSSDNKKTSIATMIAVLIVILIMAFSPDSCNSKGKDGERVVPVEIVD